MPVTPPWDSPHNIQLLPYMPDIFRSNLDPADSVTTRLQRFIGEGAPFHSASVRFDDLEDGLSNTILHIETGPNTAVPWTQPGGIEFDPSDPFANLGTLDTFTQVGFGDGSVHLLHASTAPETLNALITHQGGETVIRDREKDIRTFYAGDALTGFSAVETYGSTIVSASHLDVLTVQLLSPVSGVINISTSDPAVEIEQTAITISAENWNRPHSITLRGTDIGGDECRVVEVSVWRDGIDPVIFEVTVVPDFAGLDLSRGYSVEVSEDGTTDQFHIQLDSRPTADVFVDIGLSNSEAAVDSSQLTFSPSNWDRPQAVTVSGFDDDFVDGPVQALATLSVTSADADYAAVNDMSFTVTVLDDDVAGFRITESDDTTSVSESGTSDSISIRLDARPYASVVIEVIGEDSTEFEVSPQTLTFAGGSWSTPQTITFTGIDDHLLDGSILTSVTLRTTDISHPAFRGLETLLTVETTDDDIAGISIDNAAAVVSESGTSDTFDVVLDAIPASPVIVAIDVQDSSEASAAPDMLTFDASNWNQSQTITLTGVDDEFADGDIESRVIVRATEDSDEAFRELSAEVIVTTIDDESAGITVVESDDSTQVSETGTTDTVSVVLDAPPMSAVVLEINGEDDSEVALAPGLLTFDATNWNVAQNVTITGVDDLFVDGDMQTTVNIVVRADSADEFENASAALEVTTLVDDVAGISVQQSNGTTVVEETGTTDSLEFVLDASPLVPVVLELSGSDATEFSLNVTQLTFDSDNWNVAQTVTVTGLDDELADGDIQSSLGFSVTSASDSAFRNLTGSVDVTTIDDEVAGFTVSPTDGDTIVDEAGSSDSFSVVLDAVPVSSVVLELFAGDDTEFSFDAATVTFDSANWNVAQTIVVTGLDDDLVDGDVETVLTISVSADSDSEFEDLSAEVTVTTLDNDVAGFTVSESNGGTQTSEAGATDSLNVLLDAAPVTPVVFSVAGFDASEITASPLFVTFDASNWNVAQTITMTGVDDDLVDGDIETPVALTATAGSDAAFRDLAAGVTVTNVDDDVAGLEITESAGDTKTSEASGSDTFSVSLTSAPLTPVVFELAGQDATEFLLDVNRLTFDSVNWNIAQTVTVTGADDDLVDGDIEAAVVVTVAAGSDAAFVDLHGEVSVNNVDDDVAGVSISETDGNTQTGEDGSSDLFQVVLDAAPLTPVVFSVAGIDATEISAAPLELTFDSSNWNVPQDVTVTGLDDDVVDGDITLNVSVSATSDSDAAFREVGAGVSVINLDNDVAGFLLTETDGSTLTHETGTSDSFRLVLDAAPLSDVFLEVTGIDSTELDVTPEVLTFHVSNWNVPQSVSVTGIDDDLVDGDLATSLTISSTEDSDSAFAGLSTNLTVTNVDDDVASLTLTESGGETSTTESGTTDTIDLVLDAAPVMPVVFEVTGIDETEIDVVPRLLTFNSSNWNSAQRVTLTGMDDDAVDGDVAFPLTFAVTPESDAAFRHLSAAVQVTNTDNDIAGLQITESNGSSVVSESGTQDSVTVSLTAAPLTPVVLDLSVEDVGEFLIDTSSLTFDATNWNAPQSVVVTGLDDVLVDGDIVSRLFMSVALGSNSAFVDLAEEVAVTTEDNDVAGITVQESNGTTMVDESGAQDSVSVVLDAAPLVPVVLTIEVSDASEISADASHLTFDSSNWNVPQTVIVTGVDDVFVDGNMAATLSIAVADGSADAFQNLTAEVDIQNADNDDAGFTITESSGETLVGESGTVDSFDIVLNAAPLTPVIFAITGADTSEFLLSESGVTFDSANWNVPQTVSITGVDDELVDGAIQTSLAISVTNASNSAFVDLTENLVVTVSDDDVAGLNLIESADETVISENQTNDTIEVTLAAAPLTPVMIELSGDDSTEFSFAPGVLTFDVDAAFRGLTQNVSVTTEDNDSAGFQFELSGPQSISENAGTTELSLVLTAGPLSDVILEIETSDTDEAMADVSTFVFTPANWSQPQTVMISGVDELTVDGDQTVEFVARVLSGSTAAFLDLAEQSVAVSVTDDDLASVSIIESEGSTTVTENGNTDEFTVVLDRQPLSDVYLNVASVTGEVSANTELLAFTYENWSTPQSVTITAVDDVFVDGSQSDFVTPRVNENSADGFRGLSEMSVEVTVNDDDLAGFTLEISSNALVESGADESLAVVLDRAPLSDVEISIAGNSDIALNHETLVFTPENWNVRQVVSVEAVDNVFVDGDRTAIVELAVNATGSDSFWQSVNSQSLQLSVTDDDVAAFSITETAGATSVSEAGLSDEISLVLDRAPVGVVTIHVATVPGLVVSPASIVFDADNWQTAQQMQIMAVDDDAIEDDAYSNLQFTVADNSDSAWTELAPQTVAALVIDDDHAGLVVEESDAATLVSEGGTDDSVIVRLTAMPASAVVVTISTDSSDVESQFNEITLTPQNWSTGQVVSIDAVDDNTVDGEQQATIQFAIDADLSDNDFSDVAPVEISVLSADDDVRGFSVTETAGSTVVSESGKSDELQLVLDRGPLTNVVLLAAESRYTFTPTNWQVPQRVVVTATDDSTVEGDLNAEFLIEVDMQSDAAFVDLASQSISYVIEDDDEAGFEFVPPTDGEESAEFTGQLRLTAQPLTNVVFLVDITGDDAVEPTDSQLTFTPDDWNVAQEFSLLGVANYQIDPDRALEVSVTVDAAATDALFDDLDEQTASVEVYNDDVAGIVVTGPETLQVNESGRSDSVKIRLTAEPDAAVVVTVSVADERVAQTFLPNLTFHPQNWDRDQTVAVSGIDNIVVSPQITTALELRTTTDSPSEWQNVSQDVSIASTDDGDLFDPDADADKLLSYNLTFQDLADSIRRFSIDLPAGAIDSDSGTFIIRTRGQAYSERDFSSIPIRAAGGAEVRLGDVARVVDGFEDGRKIVEFNGEPALFVEVMRTGNESAIDISNKVHGYVESAKSHFPDGIRLFVWDDNSQSIRGRLSTLLSSLLQGSLLVLLVLGLFLRPSLAFWIVVGIPVGFAGGVLLMPAFGITANVMSLFGYIIVVGIVVDDAIVTGENIYSKIKAGLPPLEAAVEGTHEVATPVTFGALTTMVAFIPLLFFEGTWGDFAKQIPPVVAPVLLFSLIESKLILPSHLKHIGNRKRRGLFTRFQDGIAGGLEEFIERVYQPSLVLAVKYRSVVMAAFVAMGLLMAGYCMGGRMGFVSFPTVDTQRITAIVDLPDNTPLDVTAQYVARMADALEKLREEFVDPGTGESIIQNVTRTTGSYGPESHFDKSRGWISVEVLSPDRRTEAGPKNNDLATRWTELIGPIPEATTFRVFAETTLKKGREYDNEFLNVELRGPTSPQKAECARDIKNLLESYDGISTAWAHINYGQDELELSLKPRAAELGLTQVMLAQQIRQAFYGEEAQRVQRGIDDIRVMVRLPKKDRESLHTLDQLKIRTPRGANVPLETIADVSFTKAPSFVERNDGAEIIRIGAQPVDEKVDVLAISKDLKPKLDAMCRKANLSYLYLGYVAEAEEARERTILGGILLALTLYGMLSIPLKSLVQPFFVMLAVPFAIIGALLGHIYMDMTPSYLSVFGMLALAGVAVNDTLVMVDYINRRRAEGIPLLDAALEAGGKRFRPIMLTSVTTFAGLLPLMMDRSLQAQFLIPMTVSLAFGVLFATAVTLYLVPCSLLMAEDLGRILTRARDWYVRPFQTSESSEAIET